MTRTKVSACFHLNYACDMHVSWTRFCRRKVQSIETNVPHSSINLTNKIILLVAHQTISNERTNLRSGFPIRVKFSEPASKTYSRQPYKCE